MDNILNLHLSALEITKGFYDFWIKYQNDKEIAHTALAMKTEAIVLYDRLINQEYVPIGKHR